MKVILFCPSCCVPMQNSDTACDNCNEVTTNPIIGQFSDEDAARLLHSDQENGE